MDCSFPRARGRRPTTFRNNILRARARRRRSRMKAPAVLWLAVASSVAARPYAQQEFGGTLGLAVGLPAVCIGAAGAAIVGNSMCRRSLRCLLSDSLVNGVHRSSSSTSGEAGSQSAMSGKDNLKRLRGGATSEKRGRGEELRLPSGRGAFVEPSVLAADIGALSAAAHEMSRAGATWTHVDIGDGSIPAGRQLTSLGPASVAALKRAAPDIKIDVHLYTLDPEAHIGVLAEAGADRITFQIEHVEASLRASEDLEVRAHAVADAIHAAGCHAGVCLAPHTPLSAIESLVASGKVDLVDVLAVLPGIGGQKFRPDTLDKVRALRVMHPELPYLMVDGGVDATTCPLVAAAGANVVVSGSYLFGAPPGEMGGRLAGLEAALLEHGS